ncbi:MAG: hypothetical protein WBH68_04280 [Erysipelotrichaceae bacterium]|nr:hypothetical protein [Erysipelotrichaceae bacterium]HCY06065.1 hypothetical protein [Erysipelotrichaceae bacterium]
MKVLDIIKILNAKPLYVKDEDFYNVDFNRAFASDLMSDVLALIKKEFEETLLLTGLCNAQSLRTAEMLDLKCLIYVRGKELDQDTLELAKEMDIAIFTTNCTMYEACGRLYQKGLSSIDVV